MRNIIRVTPLPCSCTLCGSDCYLRARNIILAPPGDRGTHGKGRLDPFNERTLHELLLGEHTGRLYLYDTQGDSCQ